MENITKKRRNSKKTGLVESKWTPFKTTMFVIIVLYIATLIGAVAWAFFTSLKDKYEYLYDAVSLPKEWLFSNYGEAFRELARSGKSVPTMLLNSLWLSVLPPTISILTASMASYVMAQYKFIGRDVIWAIMIFMMTLPIMGNGAAIFKLYKTLGMYNSPLILLRNITGLGGSLLLIASFKGLSKTYMEAGFIEGAGHFHIFVKIMLPQVLSVLTALWIMDFIGCWNDYMTPIMYLPKYTPITTGLYIYQLETAYDLNTPVLFAGSLMVLAVPLVLFAIFQNKFSELSFGGGIKA